MATRKKSTDRHGNAKQLNIRSAAARAALEKLQAHYAKRPEQVGPVTLQGILEKALRELLEREGLG